MSTWYAQASSVNINRVSASTTSNVWNASADGLGAWMDTSVLTAGGTDTVLVANGKTAISVNIDIDIGTGRLSTAAEGGTTGGGFQVTGSTARVITANLLSGTTSCLLSGHTGTGANALVINGNSTGGGPGSGKRGFDNTDTGSVIVNGNVTGGSGAAGAGLYNASTGVVTINGDVTSGSVADANGVENAGAGAVTVTGSIINNTVTNAIKGQIIYAPLSGSFIQYPTATGTANYTSGSGGGGTGTILRYN